VLAGQANDHTHTYTHTSTQTNRHADGSNANYQAYIQVYGQAGRCYWPGGR